MISRAATSRTARSRSWPALRVGRLPGWLVVFLGSLPCYLAVGWYLTMILAVFDGDAVSRTAQAAYVLFGRDPHLAALGFVWNPLPSLVQLPLVAILHPVGLVLLAGPIQSAIFMAGAAALLWQAMRDHEISVMARIILIAIFATNPMVVLYAANGMSEAMFSFFLIGTIFYFARWARDEQPLNLIGMALMTAGTFGVRYEALPLAAAGFGAICLLLLTGHDRRWARIEATLLVYLTPFCYAVALWVFFNWSIVGDPFYFQRSVYSNNAQTAAFASTANYLSGVVGSPAQTLSYVAARFIRLFPAFVLVQLGAVTVAVTRRSWALLGISAMLLSVPAFHLYVTYSGASWGWLRFFMYSIPGAFLLAAPLITAVRARTLSRLLEVALVITFLASTVMTLGLMRDPNYGRQEQYFLGRLGDRSYPLPESRSNLEARMVALWIEQHLAGQTILLDTVRGYGIWLYSPHPEQLIIVSDRDFPAILAAPSGNADYLLVPSPEVESADSINARYPTLYTQGLSGMSLVQDFGGETGWRLFRILPNGVP